MNHVFAPLFTLGQATGGKVGLLLIAPFPIVVIVVRWRNEPDLRKRLTWLFALPMPWVLLAYWTALHWHENGPPLHAPKAAEPFAIVAIVSTLLLAGGSVGLNRGARRFFCGWALVNI